MDDSDFDEDVEFYNKNILQQNKRYFRLLIDFMVNNRYMGQMVIGISGSLI